MNDKKRIIASNLTLLRKNKGLTQAELAEKLNYSDKAISRWERGDTLPDIDMLCELCEFYGITLNDLINENFNTEKESEIKDTSKDIFGYKVWLCALCVSVVWLCATILFVYSKTFLDTNYWMAFVWAVPISCVMIRLNIKWTKYRAIINLINSSILAWSFIASCFLHLLVFSKHNLWPIFIIGVPIQIIIIIFYKMKELKG